MKITISKIEQVLLRYLKYPDSFTPHTHQNKMYIGIKFIKEYIPFKTDRIDLTNRLKVDDIEKTEKPNDLSTNIVWMK